MSMSGFESDERLNRFKQMMREGFDKPSTKARDLEIGELYAAQAKEYGELAAKYLFRGQWHYGPTEWFDHRLHLLDPQTYWNDFWTASADNVTRVLPYNGSLLDLCSGDGFYDYHFYCRRAEVICIEKDPEALEIARRCHAHPRITYIEGDVLDYEPTRGRFDVVLLRGAVEHFTVENQLRLFTKAYAALKPNGYFCGDTMAAREGQDKLLATHEHEWKNEDEMREALLQVFAKTQTEVWTLVSAERNTLMWRCRKG